MCGIAGVVDFDGTPSRRLVEDMCAALQHRGPDDEGIVEMTGGDGSAAAAVFGSRRLSIIDVAGGHQPMSSEDGRVSVILNGEIYNFSDLRDELESRGHRFVSSSDTEVVVHAYEQWGEACVARLDGMFALAVWDARAERLLLARDRFGKKPLVYFDAGSRLVFASELQALARVPGFPREIDMAALGEYLAYMAIPAPQTIYRRVRKLPPAHLMTRDRRGTCVRRYWSLEYQPKSAITESAAVERVRELIERAVVKRLVGERPLGAFLSGGVDSSAVVATMARVAGGRVKTFSIGFEQAEYDELPHARRVAAAFACDHHELVVRPSAVEILPALVQHFGEPYADSSAIPSWYLAKLTSGSVTVALNGDGGDEVFAGYGRHLANSLAEQWQHVPGGVRRSVERVARGRLLADFGGSRAARFVYAAGLSRAARYRAWAGVFGDDLMREISGRSLEGGAVEQEVAAADGLDAVDAVLAVDTKFYLPTDLLPKVDITSMAHSLEVRSPLLDVPLAEFVASLPSSLKLRRWTTKHLLKRAMEGRIPRETLRRPKRGFAVPIAAWLRGELRAFLSDHLQRSQAAAAGLLEQRAIDRLIADHLSGAPGLVHHVWVLLMLELWYRRFQTA